jgi:hypothetical protein
MKISFDIVYARSSSSLSSSRAAGADVGGAAVAAAPVGDVDDPRAFDDVVVAPLVVLARLLLPVGDVDDDAVDGAALALNSPDPRVCDVGELDGADLISEPRVCDVGDTAAARLGAGLLPPANSAITSSCSAGSDGRSSGPFFRIRFTINNIFVVHESY